VGMGNLAKMAQQMQADMGRVEQELRDLEVEGSAGGGVVKAVVTGKQDIVSITIDPGVVDPEDVDMLQDLVVAAVGDAITNARKIAEDKVSRVTGGLQIPGM
jgi:DNA-binding YbaB/EbfC family protein